MPEPETTPPAEPVPGLRDQIAGAARHAADSAYGNTPFIDAITDAVLAVVQPAIDEARGDKAAGQRAIRNLMRSERKAVQRAEAAEAATARVEAEIRDRHARASDGTCEECIEFSNESHTTYASWPCPTIRDLNAALTPPVPADQPEGGVG